MALVIGVLSVQPSIRLAAQTRLWRPEDRVIVGDFSVVDAVAASPWLVYAATRHGLAIYDRRTRVWQLPVTTLDGYPTARVRTSLADPAGNGVWLGTDAGWAHYDADLRRWDVGTASGAVSGLMLDSRDAAGGVFIRDRTGWKFLPRGALLALPAGPLPPPERRVQPLDVQAALASAPLAQALRAFIFADARFRAARFTAAARSADDNDLFFGTDGRGVVRLDAVMGQWEPLGFTLAAAGADAVALGPRGVWAASTARVDERGGVTWLPDDLTSTQVIEPLPGTGIGTAAVRRAIAAPGGLWVATDAGVYRVDPATGRARRWTVGEGLPSEDVRCLAPAPDGVWIGTARGLVVIVAGDRVVRVGSFADPVLSLLAVRETLWVGSAAGLGVMPPGAVDPIVPPAVAAEPALRAPIVALARTGDTLVALLSDQVAWRDPASGRWTVTRPVTTVGPLIAAAGDAGGVWLGGTLGLAWWSIARSAFRVVAVPGDLPAPVRDVVASAPYVWVATDSGVVRLRRDAVVGGLR